MILIVPSLQLILIINGTENCNQDLKLLISIGETLALFFVPLCWWSYVWFIIYSIKTKMAFWNSYDITNYNGNDCNLQCLKIYTFTLLSSILLLGLFVMQFLLVFHSFYVWQDDQIICNDSSSSIKSGLYFLDLIWLIDNICICLILFCCVVVNSN